MGREVVEPTTGKSPHKGGLSAWRTREKERIHACGIVVRVA